MVQRMQSHGAQFQNLTITNKQNKTKNREKNASSEVYIFQGGNTLGRRYPTFEYSNRSKVFEDQTIKSIGVWSHNP